MGLTPLRLGSGLAVCVLYGSSISPQVHHTALMYDVTITLSADEAAKIESGSIPQGRVISLRSEQISLHKMEIINGLAD